MLGDHPIFTWKSKEAQQREQEEYELWAFPFGEKQRANLSARLLEAFPKETIPTTLVPFLTCKELFERTMKQTGSRDATIDHMLNEQKKYKKIITKKNMALYLAFVIADADLNPDAEYPPIDKILAKAAEYEKRKASR